MVSDTIFSSWCHELLNRTPIIYWVWGSGVSPVVAGTAPGTGRDLKRSLRLRSFCSQRYLVLFLLPASLIVHSVAVGSAKADVAEQAEDDKKMVSKSVTGKIVAVTKRSLSVEAGTEEFLLPFGKDMKLERIKSLADLKRGDTVAVGFDQTYRHDEDGQETLAGTVVTAIALVRTGSADALSSREGSPQ